MGPTNKQFIWRTRFYLESSSEWFRVLSRIQLSAEHSVVIYMKLVILFEYSR
jgi:hypothetical protein